MCWGGGQSPWGIGTYQRREHRLLQPQGFRKPVHIVRYLEISQGGRTWKRKSQFPRSKSWVAVAGFPADLGVGQTEAGRVGSEGGSH